MVKRRDDVVDVLVGTNIRLVRKRRRLSQSELADAIGVTFQQVQKYENGSNRVGSGRLFKIASVLDVPISVLFDGMDQSTDTKGGMAPTKLLAGPYALRLLQAFSQLEDTTLRKSIAEMVEKLPGKYEAGQSQKRR